MILLIENFKLLLFKLFLEMTRIAFVKGDCERSNAAKNLVNRIKISMHINKHTKIYGIEFRVKL